MFNMSSFYTHSIYTHSKITFIKKNEKKQAII